MNKQLNLFPELVQKLGTTFLEEKAIAYAKENITPEVDKQDLAQAFKEGASIILGELLDLLKKYTMVYEA